MVSPAPPLRSGYLACNRFSDAVGGAHAGMTAEGDNAVLMQKVAKELLDMLRAGQVTPRSRDDSIKQVRDAPPPTPPAHWTLFGQRARAAVRRSRSSPARYRT